MNYVQNLEYSITRKLMIYTPRRWRSFKIRGYEVHDRLTYIDLGFNKP